MREYSERAGFMREMRHGDTSDSYHIAPDGELTELKIYAHREPPTQCSNEYSERFGTLCKRHFHCDDCEVSDQLAEMRQYDLDQERRGARREVRDW